MSASGDKRFRQLPYSEDILHLFTLETVSLWLKEQAWPIGLLLCLGVVLLVLLQISATCHRMALSRRRKGMTQRTFVDHLARYNFDPVITGTTYRYLREIQNVGFPILFSDALDEDLRLGPEEIEQTVRELAQALSRIELPGAGPMPMVTVEDLLRHLQALPRRGRARAA